LNYIPGGNLPGDIFGAVVDRKSGQGYVCLYQRGTISSNEPKISTGPNDEGYKYFEIEDDQGFFVCGAAAVLYIYRNSYICLNSISKLHYLSQIEPKA
jgi:hypothetical protein